MTIKIKTPRLRALIDERLKNGAYRDVAELLTRALEALPNKEEPRRKTRAEAIAPIRQSRKGNHSPAGVTIKDLINEGRAVLNRAAMASTDVGIGSEIISALDRAKLKVSVALWAHLPEYENWRLVIAARQFDSPGVNPYRPLNKVLDAEGFTPRNTPIIMILQMKDPFIRDLRKRYAKTKDIEGLNIGSQVFGDRFVEDAYVYRIS